MIISLYILRLENLCFIMNLSVSNALDDVQQKWVCIDIDTYPLLLYTFYIMWNHIQSTYKQKYFKDDKKSP